MKKIIVALTLVFGGWTFSYADHLFGVNADNITRGTLPNARLDPSSVTMRGNIWDKNVDASTGTLRSDVTVATNSLNSKVINGAIATYDDRRAQLNATTLNFDNNIYVDAGTGGTVTIRGTDKGYDLKIGTYGTEGVDMYVDNVNQWNMALASVGVSVGMVFNSSYNARILSLNQNCLMSGATIPYGVKVFGGSSSTWVDNGNTVQQFLRIYGEVYNIKLNLSGLSFTSPKIQMSSYSKLIDSDIYGAYNQQGSVANSHLIYINGAYNFELRNNRLLDPIHVPGVVQYGDAAPVRVISSSIGIVDFASYDAQPSGNTGTHLQINQSTGISVSGNFQNMGGNGINFIHGNVDCGVNARPNGRDTVIEYNNQAGDVGTVIFGEASGSTLGISTSAWVKDTQIIYRGNDTSSAIVANNGAGKFTSGLTIKNVLIRCHGTNTITGITLNARSAITVIDNVDVTGCSAALADSGVGTNKAGLRLNGITQ